ncbi:MAG: hypothetical protein CMD69_00885 [Gammaproteobacteria bacterium]|nr:hypothetical protein [Gammaproteobacteria bacterium]
MINTKEFIVSEFSENILLVSLKKDSNFSDTSSFFLSLSQHLRENIEGAIFTASEKSLSIKYDFCILSSEELTENLFSEIEKFKPSNKIKTKLKLDIPVLYSEEYGLDIKEISSFCSLSINEIAQIHSSKTYSVKMIGFTPGFAYLGDVDKNLRVPRRVKPRKNLLPGSIGISNNRTGIYSLGGPGGWNILGRTPINLFNPDLDNPFQILPDKQINFYPINKDEFESILNTHKNEY